MSSVFAGGNNDSLWYEYSPEKKSSLRKWYEENYYNGFPRTYTSSTPYTMPIRMYLADMLRQTAGGIPPKNTEERPEMGSNYDPERYDNYGNPKSDQRMIDEAVLEAIAKPRREAEIARRVALVTALEALTDVEVGTVLTFDRKSGKDNVLYAALKTKDDMWSVTGDGRYSTSDLIQHLSTGSFPAENIQVADTFTPLAAPASAPTADSTQV